MLAKVAEQEGFEPSIRGYRIHTFQACAFDHSATVPLSCLAYRASRYLRPGVEFSSLALKQRSGSAHKNARL